MTFLPEPVVEENFYWEDFGKLILFWWILPISCCMRWFHNLILLFFLNYKKWGAIVEAMCILKISIAQCLFLNSECFHSLPYFISSCLCCGESEWHPPVTSLGEGNGDVCAPGVSAPTAHIHVHRLCGHVLKGYSCSFPSPTIPVHVTLRCLSVGCSKWRLCFIPLQTAAGDYTLKIIRITFLSPKF